jgi:hypothetical protein
VNSARSITTITDKKYKTKKSFGICILAGRNAYNAGNVTGYQTASDDKQVVMETFLIETN